MIVVVVVVVVAVVVIIIIIIVIISWLVRCTTISHSELVKFTGVTVDLGKRTQGL